ncbi:hypothetical protein [Actinocrispum wychmicini]|uniref:Uncharacterized protein n=1 Tax=Actinocrispum wychmicini TaxID=1213861 RepID=A0A4R2IQY8_9PSEU|nr:hypothetical protein [Actinocrispum wychmicini]TCO46469.1 hypothetical protein EV192_11948 [Actinocrispum wychmicini]
MAQPRPMSTPIFDELLREFASRMEEQREREEPPAGSPPASAAQPAQSAASPSNRHRAD